MPITRDVIDASGQALAPGDKVSFEHELYGTIECVVIQVLEECYFFCTGDGVPRPAVCVGPSMTFPLYWLPPHRLSHEL